MRHVGRLFGRTQGDVFLGGVLVAWLSFVLAMVALYYLARLDLPRRGAERAVLLTSIFPFAFFFGVAYSESTFLLFTVLAFYFIADATLGTGRTGRLRRRRHTSHGHSDVACAGVDRVASC